MTTLREFSRAGPCITLGTIVADQPNHWLVSGRPDRQCVRVMKTSQRAKSGLIHAEPCRSCRDHPRTQYPEGYMD